MIILLHSSKTMRSVANANQAVSQPILLDKTLQLDAYLKTLSVNQLTKAMHITPALATKTHRLINQWNNHPDNQSLALDSFVGDIYSGLQADTLTASDREYGNQTLRILSGLYGVLKPFDGVMPYRLEMAYKFPKSKFSNLYNFWAGSIADTMSREQLIINTSSLEYTRTVIPFFKSATIITPTFLTLNAKTGQPTQVIVHTKIARGAFAHWLITSRIVDPAKFAQFSGLNYQFDPNQSTPLNPVYVCEEFGGIGLSMRLK